MNTYTFNVCGVKGSVDLDNLKIKNCPYCKKELKLKWYAGSDEDDEQGYICSSCGMFLDIELLENKD